MNHDTSAIQAWKIQKETVVSGKVVLNKVGNFPLCDHYMIAKGVWRVSMLAWAQPAQVISAIVYICKHFRSKEVALRWKSRQRIRAEENSLEGWGQSNPFFLLSLLKAGYWALISGSKVQGMCDGKPVHHSSTWQCMVMIVFMSTVVGWWHVGPQQFKAQFLLSWVRNLGGYCLWSNELYSTSPRKHEWCWS